MSSSNDRVRSNRKLFLQYLAKLRRQELESGRSLVPDKKESFDVEIESGKNDMYRCASEGSSRNINTTVSEGGSKTSKTKKVGFILTGQPKTRTSLSQPMQKSALPTCEQFDYGLPQQEPSQVAVMRMLCIAAFESSFIILIVLSLRDMIFKDTFWTTYVIYGPGSILCMFASCSWRARSAFFLRILDMVLSVVEVLLLCYVSFALFREGDDWGYVALAAVIILFPLKIAAAAGHRAYKNFRRKFSDDSEVASPRFYPPELNAQVTNVNNGYNSVQKEYRQMEIESGSREDIPQILSVRSVN